MSLRWVLNSSVRQNSDRQMFSWDVSPLTALFPLLLKLLWPHDVRISPLGSHLLPKVQRCKYLYRTYENRQEMRQSPLSEDKAALDSWTFILHAIRPRICSVFCGFDVKLMDHYHVTQRRHLNKTPPLIYSWSSVIQDSPWVQGLHSRYSQWKQRRDFLKSIAIAGCSFFKFLFLDYFQRIWICILECFTMQNGADVIF